MNYVFFFLGLFFLCYGACKQKNKALSLLSILLIISALGMYFWQLQLKRAKHDLQQKIAVLKADSLRVNSAIKEFGEQADLRTSVKRLPRIMLQNDDAIKTVNYLNLLKTTCTEKLEFEIAPLDTLQIDSLVFSHTYLVSGTASIDDLYSFLEQIEIQPSSYFINRGAVSTLNRYGDVGFSFWLQALYLKTQTKAATLSAGDAEQKRLVSNPFYQRLGTNWQNEALDINRARLIYLNSAQAFVLNPMNGLVFVIVPGQQVENGFLEKIEDGLAIFRINDERVILKKEQN